MAFGLSAVLIAVLTAHPVHAQLTERDLQLTGQPDEDVREALDRSSLQTEVVYLRPDADFQPDQSIEIKVPEKAEYNRSAGTLERWVWGIMFAVVLLVVIAIFISQGGAIGVSFGKQVQNARRQEDDAAPDAFDALNRQPLDQFLASLRAMADKRMALILLVSRALERAADQNDVRLGRAQTARDVIRVLPKAWPHLSALRGLVREAEVVHFGGREVSDDTWEQCFAAAEPIFQRRAA